MQGLPYLDDRLKKIGGRIVVNLVEQSVEGLALDA